MENALIASPKNSISRQKGYKKSTILSIVQRICPNSYYPKVNNLPSIATKQRAPPQKCSVGGAVCGRAHLSCEKLSRKSVATLGWRANTVRPYILYMTKLAFFAAGATNVAPAPLAVITNVRVDRRGRRPRRPVQFRVIANVWFAARANNVAPCT